MTTFKERCAARNAAGKAADKSAVGMIKKDDANFDAIGTAAEAAGTLHYFSELLPEDCCKRLCIVSSVKRTEKDAEGANGPLERYAIIGSDPNTNATLRGWITVFDDQVVIPKVGDAHKLPAFNLLKGHSLLTWNGDIVTAKRDGVYQAVGMIQAESVTAEQMYYLSLADQAVTATAEAAATI